MNWKYITGVIVVLLVLLGSFIFILNRDSGPSQPEQEAMQLVDYANLNSQVSLTTVGRVVGNDEHRSIRITVSAGERRVEVLAGYNDQVISSQSFANTQAAYETFLAALGGQGFTNSKNTNITDQRSVCATGKRYQYVLSEAGNNRSDLWSVSCDRSGTFNGRSGPIRNLFELQIPDYSDQVRAAEL